MAYVGSCLVFADGNVSRNPCTIQCMQALGDGCAYNRLLTAWRSTSFNSIFHYMSQVLDPLLLDCAGQPGRKDKGNQAC